MNTAQTVATVTECKRLAVRTVRLMQGFEYHFPDGSFVETTKWGDIYRYLKSGWRIN